jgi:hypothetical protein
VGDFITADRVLTSAAAWLGMTTANPEDHA